MSRRGPLAYLWDAVHIAGKSAMKMLHVADGEAGMARLTGSYGGGTFGGSLSKAEQVQHFRGWNYRCIDFICSRMAKEPPCAVLAADPKDAARNKYAAKAHILSKGKTPAPDPRAWVPPLWRQKAQGPAKPNEEYEFLGDESPLVRLLQDPNDPETGVSVWYELELFISLTGEGYLWVVEGGDGKPAELWVIPSHWVRPVCLGEDLLIDYFEVSPRGANAGLVRFDPDEIIYFKSPSPLSKLIGQSPLQAFSATVDSYEMTEAARYFALQNGAMVGGQIVVPPGTQLTPETINRLESRFAAKYAGVKNMARPMIFEGGAQWIPAPSDQELAFMGSMDQQRKYIIGGLWGLDECVIGFASVPSRAAMVAAMANVTENVINPRRRARAAVLTERLARRFDPKARIFYPDDTPLDPDAVRNDYSAGVAVNAVSANDYRTHVLGLEAWPEDIYDRPLVSPGLMNPGSDEGDWDGDGQPGASPDAPAAPGGADPDLGGAADDGLDPFAGLVDDATMQAAEKIVGRWFVGKDRGPPPFPGAAFDEARHRWVKPQDAAGGGENAHHAALAEHMPPEVMETPGAWERVKDAAATVAAKAYMRLKALANSPAAMKAIAIAGVALDTPDDLKKFGYNPTTSAGGGGAGDATPTTNDPMRAHVGVSTHLACTVASHVLGRASLWARKKLTGKADGDGWTEAAELVAEVFGQTNAALGLEGGIPPVAEIAAKLKAMLADGGDGAK